MATERREHQREHLQKRTSLSINNRTVLCSIKNISPGGALVEIIPPDADRVSPDDVGQEVIFELDDETGPSTYRGRIIRYLHNGGSAYLALFFL